MNGRTSRIAALGFAAFVLPRVAEACSVCFMGVESPLLDSARMGVLAMAVVLVGVLAVFARWFRKLAALEARTCPEGAPASPHGAAAANSKRPAMRRRG